MAATSARALIALSSVIAAAGGYTEGGKFTCSNFGAFPDVRAFQCGRDRCGDICLVHYDEQNKQTAEDTIFNGVGTDLERCSNFGAYHNTTCACGRFDFSETSQPRAQSSTAWALTS